MALILGSGSPARANLLAAAGIEFEVDAPRIDEAGLKAAFPAATASGTAAAALAEAKGLEVASRRAGIDVVAADQVLDFDGMRLDKPTSIEGAREQLLQLRGCTHRLFSAVCIVRDDTVAWCHTETAVMVVRNFSDAFLSGYLARCGDGVLGSVGSYQFEGHGVSLFERVEADYFSILGLPLLPLLGVLRRRGVIPS